MHIPTHILSGWCVADLLDLTPRERTLAMVAASAPDLDGLGIVASFDAYNRYHHVLCHNLIFGIAFSAVLALFSARRLRAFVLFFGLFHLHLLLDLLGSGPAWGIRYFWPFSSHDIENIHSWELYSWQNTVALGIMLAWTVVITIKRGRTPFELIKPSLDREFVRISRPKGALEQSE
jgi:hypothetical protein